MRYLVTGGSGFIGSHLVDKLCQAGHEVLILDVAPPKLCQERQRAQWVCADIRDDKAVLSAVWGADGVFHLAGLLGTHETMVHPWETADINVGGTLRVFEAVKRCGKKTVYITLGNDWENPYTITKAAAARFALMYNREFGTRITVIRGLNVYGPRQKWFPVQKVVPRFIVNCIHHEPIPVFGDGEQIIDLVYVEDTVETLVKAMETDVQDQYGTIIDAGTGISTTVNQLARMIIDLVGSKSQIKYSPMRPGEPIRSQTLGNIAKVREILGYVPKTSLPEGMSRTVAWYKTYYQVLARDEELVEKPVTV